MVTGAMPVVAKKGTEWKDVTSLVGKKFACNPSYFAYSGALMEAGVDNPLEAVEWVTYDNYNDALAAVQRGEVDFANLGTGLNQQVKKMEDIEIVSYQSEIMPNYSCCRMECSTEFLNNNPITLKLICKALLRAQAYYESNKEESCELLAKTIGADYDYVAAYMMDEKHYVVNVDPLKNSIIRAWGILDKIGFLKIVIIIIRKENDHRITVVLVIKFSYLKIFVLIIVQVCSFMHHIYFSFFAAVFMEELLVCIFFIKFRLPFLIKVKSVKKNKLGRRW